MASRKGIAITAGMLGIITVASFAIWLIPQGVPGGVVVVSDHAVNLDGVDERRAAMASGISGLLDGVRSGAISADEFSDQARESSVIVKSEVAGLLRTDAPEDWLESYGAAFESLRKLDSYISESITVARAIGDGDAEPDTSRLDEALQASEAMAAESRQVRP